jgi:transcriptional regulator GlxA family with amidase domain
MSAGPRQVALLVFDGVEVLDFAGPFEVFSVASELHDHGLFRVRLVAADLAPVTAVNGLRVLPDVALADVDGADVVIVPGGTGSRRVAEDEASLAWLRARAADATCVLGVCTGARILARAGVLAGRRFASHHQAWDELGALPGTSLVRGVRFVEDGPVVTAAGISAGIDAALYVVARLCGMAVAQRTADYMEYDWRVRKPEQPQRSGGLRFRFAGQGDVDAVLALAHSAYRGEASRAGWTTEADLLDGQRTDADGVGAMLAGGQGIVLAEREDDGRLLGCCHLQGDGSDCWFGLFAVDPTGQGHGVGAALLAVAEDWAARWFGAGRMRMKVIWLRDSLIAWYFRRGYAVSAETHPFPYGDERYGVPRRDDLYFIELNKTLADLSDRRGSA